MAFKVIFCTLVAIFIVNFVKEHMTFKSSTQALNYSLYEEILDEKLCARQISAIRENPLLKLYYAGIKLPIGVLQGNTLDMGNYHQCINFYYPLPDLDLKGKYCVIEVLTNQNSEIPRARGLPDNNIINIFAKHKTLKKVLTAYTGIIDNNRILPETIFSELELRLAMCIPEHCSTQEAFNFLLKDMSWLKFNYSNIYCRLPNDRPWAAADYTAIVVFSLLGLVTLVSTAYDLWHTFFKNTDPKVIHGIASSFSVYKNGCRLTTFKSGPDTVECIDGVRALSMAWVLIGHTIDLETAYSNPFDFMTWSLSWKALYRMSAHYAVDTFFTLSGFLVVYTTIGKVTSRGLLKNLHLFYLNRLLRIFPLLAAAVLLEASYLNWMTDGPNWSTIAEQVNRCRTAWWTTLLHIQNFTNPNTMCLLQSWYLAVDVQLHILSPIILVWILMGNRRFTRTALSVGFLVVLTASTVYIFINNFPPISAAIGREHDVLDFHAKYYVNTLTRAAPFIIGMAFGYYVRVSRKKLAGATKCAFCCLVTVKMPRWKVKQVSGLYLALAKNCSIRILEVQLIVFWTLFFGLTTFLVCINYPINQVTWDNQLMSNIYNSFVRSLWAIIVGSLIYACVNGFAGPINWFLSLRVWKIHARLSYAMYLFHYMLISAVNSTAIAPNYFNIGLIALKYLAHYSFTMAVSFLMSLLIEEPFSTLFKLMLSKRYTKQKDSK